MSASLGKEEASRPSLDKDDASSSENEDDNDTKGPITTSDAAASFASYEDYLDSQITPTDLFYVEDKEIARQLVELYRNTGEPLNRSDFEAKIKQERESRSTHQDDRKALTSKGKTFEEPLMAALAEREEANMNGAMTSIIFIRDKNERGHEISGYIDYAQRLKHEDFGLYFTGEKRLLPRPSDLSFYNWDTSACLSQPTNNFAVIGEGEAGVSFRDKRDRKVICVDPKLPPGDCTTRVEIKSKAYEQVVLYDHLLKRTAQAVN